MTGDSFFEDSNKKVLNKRVVRKLPLHLFPKVLFQAWCRIGQCLRERRWMSQFSKA